MKEKGFPPPGSAPRDLDFERSTQEEYYRLQEAGTLPRGESGEPISFSEYMDRAYAGDAPKVASESSGDTLQRTDFEDGSSVQINRAYAKTRDSRTRRRGKGGNKQQAAEESTEAVEAEQPSGFDIKRFEKRLDEMSEARAVLDSTRPAIIAANRSLDSSSPTELLDANDAFIETYNQLAAHWDSVERYEANEASAAELEREMRLLKETLAAAERFLTLHRESKNTGVSHTEKTREEKRKELRRNVQEMENLKEAQDILSGEGGIQEKYFSALEAFNKKRGALSIAAADWVGHEALTSKELKDMRKVWIRSRAALSNTMRASVDARLEATPSSARDSLLERMNQKYGNAERGSLHARYERRYGRAAIILDAEREELAARERGLSGREKKMLDRMYDRYKNLPPGVRILSTSALMIGGAAALAGTPVGWTALGLAGSGALLRWAGEARKNSALGLAGSALSISGVIGLGIDKMAGLAHAARGTKGRAAKTLAQTEGFGNLGDVKNLEKAAKRRRAALNAEANIARHRRWARVLGSIGAGWWLGHSGSASSAEGSADAADTQEAGGAAAESPGAGSEAAAPAVESAEQTSGAPAAAVETVSFTPEHVATIETGEGFNTLFRDLQDSVRASGDTGPVAQRLLSMSPTELSDSVNAFDPETGGSMVMQPGDKLYIDEHDNLVFERAGETTVLMEAEGGNVETHAFEDPRMMGMHDMSAPIAEAQPGMPAADAAASAGESLSSPEREPVAIVTENTAEGQEPRTPAADPAADTGGMPRATLTPQPGGIEGSGTLRTQSLEDYTRNYAEGESAADVFTNGNGVEVLSSEPHAYAVSMPGTGQSVEVVYGGASDLIRADVLERLRVDPAAQVFVNHTEVNATTGAQETYLGRWYVDEGGEPRFEPVVNNTATGARMTGVGPEQFVRRID